MLDIDRFKYINDGFGHSEGDKTLKAVTDILKKSAHDHEYVFRFAGDEFIILKRTKYPDELIAYMDEVNRQLGDLNCGGHPYPIRLSYGISAVENGDIDQFMKEMDNRMYAMKAEHHKVA